MVQRGVIHLNDAETHRDCHPLAGESGAPHSLYPGKDLSPGVPSAGLHTAGADKPARGDGEYAHLDPLLARYAEARSKEQDSQGLHARLVSGYLPVAQHLARRYHGRGEPIDDLVQVACIGLLKAIDRFQPDLGAPFLAYAIPTITGEMRRHFRDFTWAMRVPRRLKDLHLAINRAVIELSQQLNRAPRPSDIALRLGISVEEVLEGMEAGQSYHADSLDRPLSVGENDSTLADVIGADDRAIDLLISSHALAPHLAGLPERERAILLMRFYDDMTQSQIAAKIGVSQMHVSRLLSKTLAYLRDAVDGDHPAASCPDHPLTHRRLAGGFESPGDALSPRPNSTAPDSSRLREFA